MTNVSTPNKESAFERYHIDISLIEVKKAQSWFDKKILAMDKQLLRPNAIMSETTLTARLIPGKLYAFKYLPKGKKDLPYYDTFPMIFPLSVTGDNFMGLNMHYLNYPMRFALFRELMKAYGPTNLTENSRLRMNWDKIQKLAKAAPAQACIKQYRFDHIKSLFMEIKPDDWTTAMVLPLAKFEKATEQAVWRDSAKMRKW
jgi:hypothetical protein